MSNVIRFPKVRQKQHPLDSGLVPVIAQPRTGLFRRMVRGVGVVVEALLFVVLTLAVTRWAVTAVATFYFFRMLYYLNQPEIHAGWTFLMWFGLLVMLHALPVLWTPGGKKFSR